MAARHALLDDIARLLVRAGGSYALVPASLEAVQARALAIESGPELLQFVGDAVDFAAFIDKQLASPSAARALVAMLEPVIERLDTYARRDGRLAKRRAEAQKKHEQMTQALDKKSGVKRGVKEPSDNGVGLRRRR